MSTLSQLKAAEERMEVAANILRTYTSRPAEQAKNHRLHLQLAEELRHATEEYYRLVLDLRE